MQLLVHVTGMLSQHRHENAGKLWIANTGECDFVVGEQAQGVEGVGR
jgi:hypothetical protein